MPGQGNPGEWFIFFDPPRHTKLRALISKAFTPRVVANLEPRIRELSRTLLDNAIVRGEMDLVEDYSLPLPMMVIAELIGVPVSDWPRYKRWSDVILKIANTFTKDEEAAETVAEYRAVTAEMRVFVNDLIVERRTSSRDDLLTRLVQAEVDGQRLSDDEVLGFMQLLLVGGQETTVNLINNAVLCLLDNRDQLARLQASPELLPSAIEEVLRYRSPLQWMPRATRRDVEIHGQVIPPGKLVLPLIGSANRDPKHFPDPGRFDITRDPNPHIAFGHGIHACLGAPLARLEARIALAVILTRLQNVKLASAEPWEPRRRFPCMARRACQSGLHRPDGVTTEDGMPDDNTFRLAYLVVVASFLPFGLYYRIRSVTTERLDRRQEGAFILFGLRLALCPYSWAESPG